MNFSDLIDVLFAIFMFVSISIWFALRFFRQRRYQQDDDQYIP
ncbi:hypothetical protein [Acinetobacter pittii]|nr:hypothetical protein [Acinetobacter pittii]